MNVPLRKCAVTHTVSSSASSHFRMPFLMDFALSFAETDGAAARVERDGNELIGVPMSWLPDSQPFDTAERRASG